MREEIEIIISESLPWIDRNSPPPGHREVERITAAIEHNPRHNHPKRLKAAKVVVEDWVKKHGGQIRSFSATQTDSGAPGFLVIIEGYKPLPRQRPVTRVGPHAPKNKLVKKR